MLKPEPPENIVIRYRPGPVWWLILIVMVCGLVVALAHVLILVLNGS